MCEEKAVGWSELKAALVLLKLALAARHVAYWLHSTVTTGMSTIQRYNRDQCANGFLACSAGPDSSQSAS